VFQSTSGVKLLQLKNPWQRKSWKGKYSPSDTTNWLNSLRNEGGYDPIEAAKHDDGIFYIAWEDILLYFRNLQLSWNPRLFTYRLTTHGMWPESQGPKNDNFNIGENPQYILQLSDEAVARKPSVWVLLSRHVDKQEQEGEEVKDFLTIHLLRNSSRKERVWYPHGPDTLVNGAYTNNPHVLLRYDVSGPQDKFISLVLSQHEKTRNLAYTLSCYCTERFTLGRPPEILPCSKTLKGAWTLENAGGPVGSPKFFMNPMFAVTVAESTTMQLRCSCSKANAGRFALETTIMDFMILPSLTSLPFLVNIMLISLSDKKQEVIRQYRQVAKSSGKTILDSGNYRHGFTVTEMKSIGAGTHVLLISTYETGQLGPFAITIASSADILEVKSVS
jgi:calpain-7